MTTATATPAPTRTATGGPWLRRRPAAHRREPALVAVTLAVAAVLANLFLNDLDLYIFNLAVLAYIGASALNFLMGTAGQVSIGNAAFMAVGAFTAVIAQRAGLSMPLGVVGGALTAGIAGALFGLPAIRLRGLYLALSTLAAQFIVLYAADQYLGEVSNGHPVILQPAFIELAPDQVQARWSMFIVGAAILVTGLFAYLTSGPLGRRFRLLRDQELAASVVGVRVGRFKIGAFVISSAVIGLQGALYAYLTGVVGLDNFTLIVAVNYIAMVVIGGLDSAFGSLIGAFAITWLPQLITQHSDAVFGSTSFAQKGPEVAQVIYGLLIIGFVAWAPDGLAGLARRAGRALRSVGARVRPATAGTGPAGAEAA